MDDDYSASIKRTDGGAPACPSGKIRRVGYTKRNGSRVKSACIKDRGAKGRWQTVRRMMGIGPLGRGDLIAMGYSHTKPTAARHEAIDKAVQKYGRNKTIRKLNAIATYSKRTAPTRALVYKRDMHYVQKKY